MPRPRVTLAARAASPQPERTRLPALLALCARRRACSSTPVRLPAATENPAKWLSFCCFLERPINRGTRRDGNVGVAPLHQGVFRNR